MFLPACPSFLFPSLFPFSLLLSSLPFIHSPISAFPLCPLYNFFNCLLRFCSVFVVLLFSLHFSFGRFYLILFRLIDSFLVCGLFYWSVIRGILLLLQCFWFLEFPLDYFSELLSFFLHYLSVSWLVSTFYFRAFNILIMVVLKPWSESVSHIWIWISRLLYLFKLWFFLSFRISCNFLLKAGHGILGKNNLGKKTV